MGHRAAGLVFSSYVTLVYIYVFAVPLIAVIK